MKWGIESFKNIDWYAFFATLPLFGASLAVLYSFDANALRFEKQIIFICIGIAVFFVLSRFEYRFLRRTNTVVLFYVIIQALLVLLFALGHISKGAQSWFNLGLFAFQPSDFAKLALIIILAKYFTRRHIEIRNIKHIFVSGIYALIPFVLVFVQPDFGNAIILFFIWFGMILISGISKKHLSVVFGLGAIALALLWQFVFAPYQKARIQNFFNPLADVRGSGYNANQSVIAVGSGELTGKGFGYGTQSRLQFLPEYETDFIFAAFAEEWGFIGAMIIVISFFVLVWRILRIAYTASSNFETLFALGTAILILSHFLINVGMNIGVMPVTGITLPFMSYGGSHIIFEMTLLGMLMGMRKYSLATHRNRMKNEFLGLE